MHALLLPTLPSPTLEWQVRTTRPVRRPPLPNHPSVKQLSLAQLMVSRQQCLCCGHVLLRHIHDGQIEWHCHHCHQIMPI